MTIGSQKSKKHHFIIRIGMDKACTRKLALREVKDALKGADYFTNQYNDSEPGQFWIRGVRAVPKKAVRR